jgi:uncharacterized lipoprotein YajG
MKTSNLVKDGLLALAALALLSGCSGPATQSLFGSPGWSSFIASSSAAPGN